MEELKIKVLESDKNKLKLEINDITFVNLVNENAWGAGAELSSFSRKHPYLTDPVLTVRAKNPKKVILDAAAQAGKDAAALRKKIKK